MSPVWYLQHYGRCLTQRLELKTVRSAQKIKYLIVYDAVEYDHNTVVTKRVKYDKKWPFTTGDI